MSFSGSDLVDDDVDLFGGSGAGEKPKYKRGEIVNKKTVIVGDGAVGKTCLIIVRCTGQFPHDYVPGHWDNYSTRVDHFGVQVEMSLWDTAGQDDYDRLRPLSYPETDVFLVCFSLVDRNSFENVEKKWIPEIQEHCGNCPFILVGLKHDLREDLPTLNQLRQRDEKPITELEGLTLMKKIRAFSYIEVSSLKDHNVGKLFEEACVCSLYKFIFPKKKKGGGIWKMLFGGSEENKNDDLKKLDYEKYRKEHERQIDLRMKEIRDEEIRSLKKVLAKDIELVQKIKSKFQDGLSIDLIQYIINQFVLIDLENHCYEFNQRMEDFKAELGLATSNTQFKIRNFFGYFPGPSKYVKKSRQQKRRVFQLFFNFSIDNVNRIAKFLPRRIKTIVFKNRPNSNHVEGSRMLKSEFGFKNIYNSKTNHVVRVRNVIYPSEFQPWSDDVVNGVSEKIRMNQNLKRIERLSFRRGFHLTDSLNLAKCLNRCKVLEYLDIYSESHSNHNPQLDNTDPNENEEENGVYDINTVKLQSLRHLNLRSSFLLTDRIFSFSRKSFPNLQVLEICFPAKAMSQKPLSVEQATNIIDELLTTKLCVLRLEYVNLEVVDCMLYRLFHDQQTLEILQLRKCVFSYQKVLEETNEEESKFMKNTPLLKNLVITSLDENDKWKEKVSQQTKFPEKFLECVRRKSEYDLDFRYLLVSGSGTVTNY